METRRMLKEQKRRWRKEKRAYREVEKFWQQIMKVEEKKWREYPPRDAFTRNYRLTAVQGTKAAAYDFGRGIRVGGVTGAKKKPITDVLRTTRLIAAALLAEDVSDFINNHLQNFQFDAIALNHLYIAIERIKAAYQRCKEICGGGKNVERVYTYEEEYGHEDEKENVDPISPVSDNEDIGTRRLIIDEKAGESEVAHPETEDGKHSIPVDVSSHRDAGPSFIRRRGSN